MFKNRALEVSMVKKNQQTEGPRLDGKTYVEPFDIDKINEVIKDQVQNTAMVLGAAYAAKKGIDTLSELIIIAGWRYL